MTSIDTGLTVTIPHFHACDIIDGIVSLVLPSLVLPSLPSLQVIITSSRLCDELRCYRYVLKTPEAQSRPTSRCHCGWRRYLPVKDLASVQKAGQREDYKKRVQSMLKEVRLTYIDQINIGIV